MITVLITGFDPFAKETINPSWEAVSRLDSTISNANIIKLQLPTEFKSSREKLRTAIAQYCPDIVLSVGQAGGRSGITPELVAINFDDASIPDNAGYEPHEETIEREGENAYFTQLPIKKICVTLKKADIPSYISTTAGTYVCNHVMYEAQFLRSTEYPQLKAGFIHIPFLPQQVVDKPGMPSLSLDDDVRGLTLAIETIVKELA
ncbi:pyroglutamyl-peptidase I [Alloscardovia venturai]|uniref:Pyrrolidone-carboxylate peptidase n=1 Tax=Alloscardovia venturai TaxID=1769421 RepID=A0ABW2Y5Y8_9BIFI